jgi:GntR family transcriptional regulator
MTGKTERSSPPAAVSTPPAYVRIAGDLRDKIETGELPPHVPVLSERELATEFEVSRMTARHALTILENEGYVYRRQHRGTFVSEPRIPLRIGSFSDEIVRSGRRPGAELLWAETQVPTARVSQALDLKEGSTVYALQRLRRADNEPIAIETTFIPAEIAPDFLRHDLGGSLWELLRDEHGIRPSRATATLEVVALDDTASEQLDLRTASPAVLLIRRTYDHDGRCFEYARDLYRADRAEFQLEQQLLDPPSA